VQGHPGLFVPEMVWHPRGGASGRQAGDGVAEHMGDAHKLGLSDTGSIKCAIHNLPTLVVLTRKILSSG
jgi:hypothetical protein